MIFYFSGNGNTKAVARYLSEKTSEPMQFIIDADRLSDYEYILKDGESLGFVFPIYCWAPPKLLLKFIKKLTIRFKSRPYIYFVTTYGDCAGKAEDVFRRALKKKGLSLDAAYGVQMPETYVNFMKMGLDTPDNVQKKYAQAKVDLEGILQNIKERRSISRITSGSMPFINTYIVRPIFYAFLVTDKKWKVSDTCTGCGRCAKVCPLGNITVDKHPVWHGNCTTCNACYHSCPQNAIQFGKATLGKGQFKSPSENLFLEK